MKTLVTLRLRCFVEFFLVQAKRYKSYIYLVVLLRVPAETYQKFTKISCEQTLSKIVFFKYLRSCCLFKIFFWDGVHCTEYTIEFKYYSGIIWTQYSQNISFVWQLTINHLQYKKICFKNIGFLIMKYELEKNEIGNMNKCSHFLSG